METMGYRVSDILESSKDNEYKFFVDASGKYLGGFSGEARGTDVELEANNIQVPFPPFHQSQRWDGQKWSDPEYTYQEKRANAYASWQEQLDMQYHDSVNGTTTWKEHVELVKNTYPKT